VELTPVGHVHDSLPPRNGSGRPDQEEGEQEREEDDVLPSQPFLDEPTLYRPQEEDEDGKDGQRITEPPKRKGQRL
jgi:hypothetical protein